MIENLWIIGFLMAYIVFSEIRNYYERKGLLDRIMSKTYNEYVSGEIHKTELKASVSNNTEKDYVTI
jgi:hypothetical protein